MHYIKIQRMIIYKFICSIKLILLTNINFVKDNILLHEIYSIQ